MEEDDLFSRNNVIARYDAWEWSPLIGPIKVKRPAGRLWIIGIQ